MDKEILIDDIIKEKASSESLVLPEDLNIKIIETISNLPIRRTGRRRVIKKAAAAAVIVLAILTGLGIAFPTYAHNVPFVGSVFQFLSGNNMLDEEYVEYSTDINVSKTSNNVKITINSIVYDGIDLSIGYTVEGKREFKRAPAIFYNELKINGVTTSSSANGTGDFIDNHTYAGVDNYHIGNAYMEEGKSLQIAGEAASIPESFTIDFSIRNLFDGTKGKWDYKFRVSTDKLKDKVKEVTTSIDLSEIAANLKVNKVTFTPVNTALRSEEDNINQDKNIQYIAFDDKLRGLPSKSANRSRDTNKIFWQYTFKNIYEDTKSVTFIPTTRNKEYEEKLKNSNGNFQLDIKEISLNLNGTTTLSIGRFGNYKVNKIEMLQDKTLIHYECTKYVAAISPYGLVIKDESDKFYPIRQEDIKEDGINKFIAEIEPLSTDKNYTLSSYDLEKQYDVWEDLKFTVPVK